ncbi:hypothetical protein H6G97_04105 [Nostoc flagelliforme FACHB-838]|uniref:Transposase n=1 Tax=Nostoc flagelliforme FACHB-838 TaxID=2692904 RepID=A0ABR8DIL3_9NOSO|nr:hypothetical protein [Nostoc flagelliforme]MBD2528791.1 hypothetical protein [Nostoc flagelliforme FACHB-838]
MSPVVDIAYDGRVRHRTAPNTVVLPFLISLVRLLDFCQPDTALKKFIFLSN